MFTVGRKTIFNPGDAVMKGSTAYRVVGREPVQTTSHRKYVLQSVDDVQEFITARVDTIYKI